MPETDIARVGKVRLRSGTKVSRSVILRSGKTENVHVKSLIPVHAFLTHEVVTVDHSRLLSKSFGDEIRLPEVGNPSGGLYSLERSPLMDAAGRRLAHYVDCMIVYPIVLPFAVAFYGAIGYVVYWVLRLGLAAWNGMSGLVASSRFLQVLLALGILAFGIVTVGFLLAVGWRLSGRLFGRKQ